MFFQDDDPLLSPLSSVDFEGEIGGHDLPLSLPSSPPDACPHPNVGDGSSNFFQDDSVSDHASDGISDQCSEASLTGAMLFPCEVLLGGGE
jgi:hypothetical protein